MSISRSSVEKIMEVYNQAEIITPPEKLKKIYSCKEQTNDTKLNLAISYSLFMQENPILPPLKKGMQLFEIPPTEDNCRSYCGLGYGFEESGLQNQWWNPDDSYILLSDITDVSCRKGFEKVFQYGGQSNYLATSNHLARQWGDGTILHKIGCTEHGATPVFRVADPSHYNIVEAYGSITKIWIKPYPTEIPAPYLRWQSTHLCNYIGSGHGCHIQYTFTLELLKKIVSESKWAGYYDKLCREPEAPTTDNTQQSFKIAENHDSLFHHAKDNDSIPQESLCTYVKLT